MHTSRRTVNGFPLAVGSHTSQRIEAYDGWRRTMRSLYALLLCSGLALFLVVSPAAAQCVSGTVTVSVSNDAGFVGLYKYCVTATRNVPQDISHLDTFLGLPDCPCICDPVFIKFPTPAGVASPPDDSCDLNFFGEYVCKGDPSLPPAMNGPAVKFNPDPSSTCSASLAGTGTFCFYSPMPPAAPGTHTNALAIKDGQNVCYGTLEGSLPICDCALPAQGATWGRVKSTYR